MELENLIKEYAASRDKANVAYEAYKELKVDQDALKATLIDKLKEIGTSTGKTLDGTYTASITKRDKIVIANERKTIAWVRENLPEPEEFLTISKTLFDPVANQLIKEGKRIDGVEVETTESLTLKQNKEAE